MTNPDSKQTVNRRVALARGWTRYGYDSGMIRWSHPDFPGRSLGEPPDFCGTWEHAGPLWDELRIWFGYADAWELVARHLRGNSDMATTEAITRARDAWKQGEER